MNKQTITIAIDGPAAAGKSTVAKLLAEKLAIVYIDTGAMYRAITLAAIRNDVDMEDESALAKLLQETKISLEQSPDGQLVFLNGENVTDVVRTEQVTNKVSIVAKHGIVRDEMVERQKELADEKSIVMDGRDIGTHVLPNATVKLFLIASVEERAERRHAENLSKGFPSDLAQLKQEIEERDKQDMNRAVAPLVKAADAIEIDTTSLTIDEVVNKMLAIEAVQQYLESK